MKVVMISESPCYPPTAGNRIRTLSLMLPLAQRHDVTFLCRASYDPAETKLAEEFLRAHRIRPLIIADPPAPKHGPRFCVRLAANLFSPLPFSVAIHNSSLVRRAIRDLAASERVDLWQFEWLAYADALPPHPQTRKIVIAHDVLSLLWQRHFETASSALKRFYIRRQWRKLERFERRVFGEATCVVAVSREDARLVRDQYGIERVSVVENGVDNDYFAAPVAPTPVALTRDPLRLLFLGSLETRPNLDGLQIFLDQVWPRVCAEVPGARLLIVGRNPPARLREQLRCLHNVELHANVPDVRPFLGQCGVMAVPLRIGGGTRIKILEALSAGLPVVSTRLGAEGLALVPGRDLVVVDDIEHMAAALVDAVRRPEAARAKAESGRRVVRADYDWQALADKLEDVWEASVGTALLQTANVER